MAGRSLRTRNQGFPKQPDGLAIRALGIALVMSLWIGPLMPVVAYAANGSINIDLSDYDGHWQRIEDVEADQARLSAIGKAVAGLSWIVRRFATPILRKTAVPPNELNFVWDGNQLYEQIIDQDENFSRPVNPGGARHFGKDQRGVDFSSIWALAESGDLRLQWEQHQATGSNLYRIELPEQTLVVEHTINVTGISNVQPIVFLSRFSRIDPIESVFPARESDDPSESAARD
jgi:hypothetical protein